MNNSAETTLARSLEMRTDVARKELLDVQARAAVLESSLRQEGVPQENALNAAVQKTVATEWKSSVSAPEAAPEQLGVITLRLSPETHDAKMADLIGILQEKGVSAAIVAAERSNNAHIIDDFHRILAEYIREGLMIQGKTDQKYQKALSMALFEVTLPSQNASGTSDADPAKAAKEQIALMEQFYRGMMQMDTKNNEYFAFEIANPAGKMHTSLYIAVPSSHKELFEKQLLALYPAARMVERHDDYNAFADNAEVAAAEAEFGERSIYALRTFDMLPSDPLDVVLNSFSKLDQTGEGAALQFVVSPAGLGLDARYRDALESVKKGIALKDATNIKTGAGRIMQEVGTFFTGVQKQPEDKRTAVDDPRVKNIERKVSSPILHVQIRIVASAATAARAAQIVSDIEAPFQVFTDTSGNSLHFAAVSARALPQFEQNFSYRLLDINKALPVNATELATLAHLPSKVSGVAAPDVTQDKSQSAAPPLEMPTMGTLLGVNNFRGTNRQVYLAAEDRLRHLYLIGQTGTGKSVLLKNIIKQDILSGNGVCFIDPHGNDVQDILASIPPERIADVIYFDPAHIERPMGLNMLEFDAAHPEQASLVVDELLGIFKKLFGAIPESMGPAFEQYFRNAALLVMSDPDSGNTLLDISRVFSDEPFRKAKLVACKNPIVKKFWQEIAEQATGDQGLQNYAPYVTSKFDSFTANEFVRPIIAQQHSAFNFRDIMDNKKILLVNLSKGRIGDLNANLLGLVIVGKFTMAALSRADSFGKELPPFYLHIDEFQNFATPSIATILSEARKYKLSLTVAHQFIAQLTDEIKNAVFGNVGSMVSFRIGADDAEFLEKQFAPAFTAADLMRVDNYNAFVKLLVKGQPAAPFNIKTLPFLGGSMEHLDALRERSYILYGRPREDVEEEVVASLMLTR
jgi:hypothetical protein